MQYVFKSDGDHQRFLLPINLVEKFDNVLEKIEQVNSYSDQWYEYIDEFESEFEEYKINSVYDYSFENPTLI